jgi:hypothetical protein
MLWKSKVKVGKKYALLPGQTVCRLCVGRPQSELTSHRRDLWVSRRPARVRKRSRPALYPTPIRTYGTGTVLYLNLLLRYLLFSSSTDVSKRFETFLSVFLGLRTKAKSARGQTLFRYSHVARSTNSTFFIGTPVYSSILSQITESQNFKKVRP